MFYVAEKSRFNALLLKIISLECLANELKCFSNEAHKIQAYLFLTKWKRSIGIRM